MGAFSGFNSSGSDPAYAYSLRQWLQDQDDNRKIDEVNALRQNMGPVLDELLSSSQDPEQQASLRMARAGLQAGGANSLDDVYGMVKAQQHAYAQGGVPTQDMREYGVAQRQGYKGGLEDWLKSQHASATPAAIQIAERRAALENRPVTPADLEWATKTSSQVAYDMSRGTTQGKADVELNTGGKIEEGKREGTKVGEAIGEDFTAIQKAPVGTMANLESMRQIDDLLKDTKSGSFGDDILKVKKIGQLLGINVDDQQIASGEAAQSIANAMALQLRSTANGTGMPGAMSDPDREFLKSMTPNLAMTAEGRKKLIQITERTLKRQQELAKIAQDYRNQNNKFDYGFYHSDPYLGLRSSRLYEDQPQQEAPKITVKRIR